LTHSTSTGRPVSGSVSVNFFSPSPLAGMAARVFACQVPRLELGQLPRFVVSFLESLPETADNPRRFLEEMHASRFGPLLLSRSQDFVLDAQEQNQLLSSSTPMPAISFGPWMIGMSSLRSAAGPTDSDAIVELVAAHLIELWVVHLCGARVVPHVLDRAIRLFD
jgi:hypothetical protein